MAAGWKAHSTLENLRDPELLVHLKVTCVHSLSSLLLKVTEKDSCGSEEGTTHSF